MSSARDRGSSRRQSNSRRSSRRKDRQKKHHLTQEDIEYLKKNTRYDESEIREWYKGFKVRFNRLWLNSLHQGINILFKLQGLSMRNRNQLSKVYNALQNISEISYLNCFIVELSDYSYPLNWIALLFLCYNKKEV